MIEIENAEVMGWEAAIRGMRNPMNSWEKSDSSFGCINVESCSMCPYNGDECLSGKDIECINLGPNDFNLMKKLCNAGADHRKFMRMITVYLDITAPLYWWKEFDTYKVGTVANSCSTMHKIAEKEFTIDDFSTEHLSAISMKSFEKLIEYIEALRTAYLSAKDGDNYAGMSKKDIWWQLIQLLPSSYNQRRTVMLNYEVLANIYKSRRNHKLDEWVDFCEWIEGLPYSELITGLLDGDDTDES